MKRLILLLALFTPVAFAGVFGVHLASKHSAGQWCDFNPGVYAVADSGYGAGVLRNSECRAGAWVGKLTETSGAYRVGVITGFVFGYKSGPQFMAVPSLVFGTDYAVRFLYLPKVRKDGAHALHMTLEKRF